MPLQVRDSNLTDSEPRGSPGATQPSELQSDHCACARVHMQSHLLTALRLWLLCYLGLHLVLLKQLERIWLKSSMPARNHTIFNSRTLLLVATVTQAFRKEAASP